MDPMFASYWSNQVTEPKPEVKGEKWSNPFCERDCNNRMTKGLDTGKCEELGTDGIFHISFI